jgi:hypothetical protein
MTYTKIHHVKRARKDIWMKGQDGQSDEILIKKGEPYYWYKFRYGLKVVSKNYPTNVDKYPYALHKVFTQLEERVNDAIENEEYDSELEDELQEFIFERNEAIGNMEEYFSDSPQLDDMKEMVETAEGLLNDLTTLQEES